MSDADGVSSRESDEVVRREIFLFEAFDQGRGVLEGGGEADFRDVGDEAVAAAGGDSVADVAGEGGAVTCGESEDVGAGDGVGAVSLENFFGLVDDGEG